MKEARNDTKLAIGQDEEQKRMFATMMDICHLKNAELETKLQKLLRQSRAPR